MISSVTTLPAMASVLNESVSSTSAYVFGGEQICGKEDRCGQREGNRQPAFPALASPNAGDHDRRAADRRERQSGPVRARAATKHQPRAEPDEKRRVVAESVASVAVVIIDRRVVERQVEAEEGAAQHREPRGPHASLAQRLRRRELVAQ